MIDRISQKALRRYYSDYVVTVLCAKKFNFRLIAIKRKDNR